MNWKDFFRKRAELKDAVLGVLESGGWKGIEDELRKDIQRDYSSLMAATPGSLLGLQLKISSRIDAIKRIYSLAGKKWEWDGVSDLYETTKVSAEDQLEETAMREMAGG